MRVPPYFDDLIQRFRQGAIGRHVHLGYWESTQPGPKRVEPDEFPKAQARLDALVLGMSGVREGEAVLDAGCGFGGTVQRIDAAHRNMRLTGINVDRRQLEICRELQSARGNRLNWAQADACCLPFVDGSFDAVLCIEAMFHFRSRARFFTEAARVLRPGGSCTGSDIVVSPGARPLENTGFPIAAVMQEGFGPWPDFWSDDADHVRLAGSAGMRGEVRDVTANVLPSHRFTAPAHLDIQTAGARGPFASALMMRWLHEQGHLRYLCFQFEKPGSRAAA
jgi:SAM-dependent methyltransferase